MYSLMERHLLLKIPIKREQTTKLRSTISVYYTMKRAKRQRLSMAGKMISIVRINLRECSQSYLPSYPIPLLVLFWTNRWHFEYIYRQLIVFDSFHKVRSPSNPHSFSALYLLLVIEMTICTLLLGIYIFIDKSKNFLGTPWSNTLWQNFQNSKIKF